MHRARPLKVFVIAIQFVALSVCAATSAHAQGFVSPLVGFNFGGDAGCPTVSDCEDKNLNLGVAFGAIGSFIGFEEELAYAKHFFGETPGGSSSVLTLMSNVIVGPKIGPVRPYVVAGLGLMKTRVDFTASSLLETSNNNFAWDVGGGLMVYLAPHVGVRGDIRYFHAFQELELLGVGIGGDKLDFGRASGALIFSF